MTWIVDHGPSGLTQHTDRPGTVGIATGRRFVQVERELDLTIERVANWSTGAIEVFDLLELERRLIAIMNAHREMSQMAALTSGRAKTLVYAEQAREVLAWRALGGVGASVGQLLAAFNILPLAERKRRFRFALASAARHGELDPSAAIARFEAGADAAMTEVARIEATARATIEAIKAASTAEGKRAAAWAVNWEWKV